MTDTCQFCGCTADSPCTDGCSWADAERTTCSRCDSMAVIAATFVNALRGLRFRAEPRRPVDAPAWAELPLEHRRTLVAACRSVEDYWTKHVADQLHADAHDALEQIRNLDAALASVPDYVPIEGETVSEAVARVLAAKRRPA